MLDPQPVKHRRFHADVLQVLRSLEQDDPTRVLEIRLRTAGFGSRSVRDLASEMGISTSELKERLQPLLCAGKAVGLRQAGRDVYVHADCWKDLLGRIQEALRAFHRANPLRSGISRNELRLRVKGAPPEAIYANGVEQLLNDGVLKSDGSLLSMTDHTIRLTPEQACVRADIRKRLRKGKTAPPDLQELSASVRSDAGAVQAVVSAMQAMGELVRLEGALLFDPDVLAEIEQALVAYLKTHGRIEVAAFRDLAGTTRKYAVPLLNYFDGKGVTVREGDVRVLKR